MQAKRKEAIEMIENWLMRVHPHYGKLHRQSGVQPGVKIPTTLLRQIVNVPEGTRISGITVTPKLKRMARYAISYRK